MLRQKSQVLRQEVGLALDKQPIFLTSHGPKEGLELRVYGR